MQMDINEIPAKTKRKTLTVSRLLKSWAHAHYLQFQMQFNPSDISKAESLIICQEK